MCCDQHYDEEERAGAARPARAESPNKVHVVDVESGRSTTRSATKHEKAIGAVAADLPTRRQQEQGEDAHSVEERVPGMGAFLAVRNKKRGEAGAAKRGPPAAGRKKKEEADGSLSEQPVQRLTQRSSWRPRKSRKMSAYSLRLRKFDHSYTLSESAAANGGYPIDHC